jgi:hypothetical protein
MVCQPSDIERSVEARYHTKRESRRTAPERQKAPHADGSLVMARTRMNVPSSIEDSPRGARASGSAVRRARRDAVALAVHGACLNRDIQCVERKGDVLLASLQLGLGGEYKIFFRPLGPRSRLCLDRPATITDHNALNASHALHNHPACTDSPVRLPSPRLTCPRRARSQSQARAPPAPSNRLSARVASLTGQAHQPVPKRASTSSASRRSFLTFFIL